MDYKRLLMMAGAVMFCLAAFQAVISFMPALSLDFGAPAWLAADPLMLILIGLLVALLLTGFGLYGLAGAGKIRRLPLTRTVLLVITAVFILRGLVILPVGLIRLGLLTPDNPIPEYALSSAIVALATGLLYLAGVLKGWRALAVKAG